MTRLDYCKQRMTRCELEEKELKLLFQELNNMLPTYKEKKALQIYFTQLKRAQS